MDEGPWVDARNAAIKLVDRHEDELTCSTSRPVLWPDKHVGRRMCIGARLSPDHRKIKPGL
jgi:hypothetical protein